MKKLLIIIICLFLVSPACAIVGNWKQIDNKIYLLKGDYIEKPYVGFWIKRLNDGDMDLVDKKKVWYEIYYILANCSDSSLYIINSISYDKNAKILTSWEAPFTEKYLDIIPFSKVVPDSMGEVYFNAGCR